MSSANSSSGTACYNGHIFIYAGTPPMPDGYPCQCGAVRHRAAMNTNDEQAPYGEKRDPMLSDADLTISVYEPSSEEWKLRLYNKCKDIRDFYENLLDDGTLIRRADLLRWADGISLDYSHNADFQHAMDLLTDHISKP